MRKTPLDHAIHSLNAPQKEAVSHIDGAMLILAGAGSGKTKTLTTRLAYLIEMVGIPPNATLTLTFTNKAAQEMRERALALLSNNLNMPPLLCTFHRFGLIFLRLHIALLDRRADFVLLDSDDKRRLIKSLAKAIPPAQIDHYISSNKNACLSPEESRQFAHSEIYKYMNKIYAEYEENLRAKNLLDFDDLLYLTWQILNAHDEIAHNISERYQYIMVDEYQDTNELQSKILKKLCTTHHNLCVVGDDDQSIYGWRGANIQNILRFPKEFQDVKLIKLEENYRSSKEILDAANTLIAHNNERLGKNLTSIKGTGEQVRYMKSEDETQEAQNIANEILSLLRRGVAANEIAILFRINALSRSIEEGLNRASIPYKLIGAMRFYERAEIKDLLCYLRLIVNPYDDFSLSRIINRPKRGIGKSSITRIESFAASKGLSWLEAIQTHKQDSIHALGQKTYNALLRILSDIYRWQAYEDLADLVEDLEKNVVFEFNKLDEVDRESNIAEFYGMFRDYIINNPTNSLQDFLNDLALSSPTDEIGGESVSCMSIHASKGLEFKYLYVIGFEEGFFPMQRGESEEIQEERRLGYVAITRAKDILTLCSAKSRLYRGRREILKPSRFLIESGVVAGSAPLYPANSTAQDEQELCKGMRVQHKLFGIGIIESVQGKGEQSQATVNFAGLRRVILSTFLQTLKEE